MGRRDACIMPYETPLHGQSHTHAVTPTRSHAGPGEGGGYVLLMLVYSCICHLRGWLYSPAACLVFSGCGP